MKTVHFEGTITTVQPVTMTTKSMVDNKRKDAPNPVPRLYVGTEQRLALLSSSIKGKLRRCCELVSFEYSQRKLKEDKPFNLDDHYFLRIGGVKGKGASDRLSPQDYKDLRSSNPMISLFGAGDPFVDGHIRVEPAVAQDGVIAQVFDGVRSNDFARSPDLLQLLDAASIEQYCQQTGHTGEISQLKAQERKLLVELRECEDNKKKAAIENSIDKIRVKLGENTSVSTQMPLTGYETIPAGTVLSHKIQCRQAIESEIGMLLHGLEVFAFEPIIGGKIANGCGEVSMAYDVSVTERGQECELLGHVDVVPYVGLHIEGAKLQQLYDGFKASLAKDDFEFRKVV